MVYGKKKDIMDFLVNYKKQNTDFYDPLTYIPIPTGDAPILVNGKFLESFSVMEKKDRELIKKFLAIVIKRMEEPSIRVVYTRKYDRTVIYLGNGDFAMVPGNFIPKVLEALGRSPVIHVIKYVNTMPFGLEKLEIYSVPRIARTELEKELRKIPHIYYIGEWNMYTKYHPEGEKGKIIRRYEVPLVLRTFRK